MVLRYLDRPVAVAALAALALGCLIPIGHVDAQGTADVTAKKKVEKFLGAGLPAKELKTSIKFVDLNGDGIPEAIVMSTDPQDCGSHGCSTNVLTCVGPAAKDIGDFIAFDLQPLQAEREGGATLPSPETGRRTSFASMGEFTAWPKIYRLRHLLLNPLEGRSPAWRRVCLRPRSKRLPRIPPGRKAS